MMNSINNGGISPISANSVSSVNEKTVIVLMPNTMKYRTIVKETKTGILKYSGWRSYEKHKCY